MMERARTDRARTDQARTEQGAHRLVSSSGSAPRSSAGSDQSARVETDLARHPGPTGWTLDDADRAARVETDLARHPGPTGWTLDDADPAARVETDLARHPGPTGWTLDDEDPAAYPRALRAGIEAVLLVADEPIDAVMFARALGCNLAAAADTLADLRIEYDADERGFELREVAGGWRLYTRSEHADVVERFVLDGQQARLTQAALETLAVVAYRQPVSRSRISAIRGVNVDSVMRTLVNRGLVEEAGSDPESSATLYRTTTYFLERLGIAGLHELPEVADFLPEIGSVEDADT